MKAWALKRGIDLDSVLTREKAFTAVSAVVVLFGAWLRINGWLGHKISLWFDEATWAIRLLHFPLEKLSIRPIGFMWLTRLFVDAFGATEIWIRVLPAVGSIAALALFPYVLSQLVTSRWIRLLGLLLFAIHPALIDYANEFKPYAWEVLIHLIPMAVYLRFRETDDVRWFYGLLAFLPVAFLFAYNLAFVYPGVLLLCLREAWHRAPRRKLVALTVASGVACALTCGVVFKLALSNVTHEERTESYWGGKYGVFYEPNADQSRLDWTIGKATDMAAFVGVRRELWSSYGNMKEKVAAELGSADRLFWVAMVAAGVMGLWKKRRELLWLCLLPLLLTVLANFLGKWPLGAFRTNIFIAAYVVPLAMLGIQFLAKTRLRAQLVGGLVLALCLIPGFAYGFDLDGHKRLYTRDHYQRQVMAKLKAHREAQLAENPRQKRLPLLLEPHTYTPYLFYAHEHPRTKVRYEEFFDRHFKVEKVSHGTLASGLGKRLKRNKDGIWIVSSSRKHLDRIEAAAGRSGTVVINERIADQHLLMFLKPKK